MNESQFLAKQAKQQRERETPAERQGAPGAGRA